METKITFTILFWLNITKSKNGAAPIYVRVTVNGRRAEISLKRSCPVNSWDNDSHRIRGRKAEKSSINAYLDRTYSRLLDCQEALQRENKLVTAKAIKARFLGLDDKSKTLLDILDYHNEHMKDVLKPGTLKNYTTTERYLKDYLKKEVKTSNTYLKDLSYGFVINFENFLRRKKDKNGKSQLTNNGIMKHMERFKKLLNLAIKLEWMPNNPFREYKMKFKKFDRAFLSRLELQKLEETIFTSTTLEKTKDIFLFACYTGLSYVDVKKLSKNHLVKGIDGRDWIHCIREKSQTPMKIPLLEKAKTILNKYSTYNNLGFLLPIFSNQKTNKYLKDIASQCGIHKKLSFHVARHTFATTVTLSNGVPIETVSKLLGHTKFSTTQIYARVVEQKIGEDMDKLQLKLGG
ncbi:site-specific recombinase XerD [Gillisia sp. Hel_I_86]|uniref:site-specific integrase n=1 Tax=Gillisia sp. Hel_I_86 TaxID=1249981 RepID=UPI00119AF330|nr:site-specific integrase [Gillisia sp. Hel_I_86]TVZ27910.1 site-specific recombinase XerD [Gillisia sp. Hel_I_86]